MSALVIGVMSGKGGVGKSTTSVNLAAAYAALEKKTLLIDTVPGGTVAPHLGIREPVPGISKIYGGSTEAICEINAGPISFKLIPSDIRTPSLEKDYLKSFIQKPYWLRDSLSKVADDYDVVIIDAPPGTSPITVGIIAASSIPLCLCQSEHQALSGCESVVRLARQARREFNSLLQPTSVLFTMVDQRIIHSLNALEEGRKLFGDMVLESFIPRNVALADAFIEGLPGIIYDAAAPGPQAYLRTADEISQRYQI